MRPRIKISKKLVRSWLYAIIALGFAYRDESLSILGRSTSTHELTLGLWKVVKTCDLFMRTERGFKTLFKNLHRDPKSIS